MRHPLRYAALAAVVVAALAVSGCGSKAEEQKPAAAPTATQPAGQQNSAPASSTPASTTPAASTVNAESLVKANCIACHGDTLDGKGAEKKNLTKVGARLSKDQIAAKITNGGGGMTAFKDKLKDNEISAIAEWLAAKK
ncbi:cytochrome c [Paenibacillus sp. GD4]|jgi:cytochrome c551|uniref:c-type cytochrome n=1 Tax=Paenibacillus sp. GD4 TaxID=3068890 RepID=UPI0027966E2C|nr:cytochrome c [Paenibacillus sp. GD4]MDQ1911094.1 cytochrome c [Paenibacillus sp. GD4]